MPPKIAIPHDQIAAFCARHNIKRLALFGSVLRDDFRSDSDVDVLVIFEEGKSPGLEYFVMEEELSSLLGRRVDLSTPGFLSQYFRDEVVETAHNLYVKS